MLFWPKLIRKLHSASSLLPNKTGNYLEFTGAVHFTLYEQLPFGLRSASFLFNKLATTIHWILENNYHLSLLIHYLNDFLLIASSESTCLHAKITMLSLCSRLSIPFPWDKLEGHNTCLSFLGIEINMVHWELRLPQSKLTELLHLMPTWSSIKKCTKLQLLLVILTGKLNFSTKVIPAGRIFLQRLIVLSTTLEVLHHHISLNSEARTDIARYM